MTVIWTQSPEELAQEKAQRRLDQLNGIPERDGPAAAEIGGGGRFGLRFARRSQDRALDRELEARKIDVLERQGDARLMNERSVAMTEALSGLRGGFGRPAVSSNLGGMSRITPQAPRASIAASIDEDLDEVDPMRPRAYKNGGVIGNVKQDDGSDKVPVVAREGEYYINPETVAHIGGGDYKQGLRSLNALVREATGKEPGPSPVGKSGLRGFAAGGAVDETARLKELLRIRQGGDIRGAERMAKEFNRQDFATRANAEKAAVSQQIQAEKAAASRAVQNAYANEGRRIGPGQIAPENVPKRDALIPRSVPANQQLVPVKQPSAQDVKRMLDAGTNRAPRPTLNDAKGWYRQGAGNVPGAGETVRIPTPNAPNFTLVNGVPEGQQLVPTGRPKAGRVQGLDISADVSQRAGQQAPINRADIGTTMNVDPQQAPGRMAQFAVDNPKAGRVIGSAKRLARFAGPIGAVSGIATDVAPVANEHGVLSNEAATQLAETSAKAAGGGLGAMAGTKIGAGLGAMTGPFAPVAAPVLGLAGGAAGYYLGDKGVEKVIEGGRRLLGLNPDSPVEQMTPEQYALRLEPSRSQADEYSDSPERAAWQASLGNGQPTASQPNTADDFRTRNAAADVYRREWQRQSPGGLRNANQQALDTYNAEQQVRGTGINAQRQANGVMEFSGSGPAPKAQYLDASGNPTNEWQDTSQYRDAVVRSLGSSDPAMQRRGLAQAMQLQQRNQRGVSTGDPRMDQLLGEMGPREAAAVFKALYGGQGADGKGPKAPSLNDQRAVAGIVSGGNGDELMAGSINNRTAFADRAQQAGVNPEVVAGIANEPLSQDQIGRNVEIARVQKALVERANAPWTDAVEGGGLGAGLGVLGSLALRLAGNKVPGLKAAAEWAKANPTFLTRILAGAGAIGGTARGLDRQVAGDPKNMKWNEFQTTFRNGIPENAVKMDEKTGKVSILKDDGSAVSFDLEDLQRQGLLADFANMITLGMVGGNKDFSENVRTLRGLSVAQPR